MGETNDTVRTQAINLFSYLRELAELRSKTVRNIDGYDRVLWFSDVPKEQECYTPAWGAFRSEDDDTWLEIKKPTIKPFPPPPKDVDPWVREADLANSSDIPEILTRIAASDNFDEMYSPEGEQAFIEIDTQPHIRQHWDKYLEEKWWPWAIENERLKKVQGTYSTLHAIYQLQKTLGETFELVLGLGLLSWKTPSGQTVRRHLVVGQASVELDGRRGTLNISPGAEGVKLVLEQDMLEASERPNPEEQVAVEDQLAIIGDALWNNPALKETLYSWINSLSSTGTYSEDLSATKEVSDKPKVTLSPALILRRRSQRSLISAFRDIIGQLKSGIQIPLGIQRIVEVVDDHPGFGTESQSEQHPQDFEEILFPLPSNDEQNRIVETINTRQGIVVQGPPGTGKSHTIANLICSLLGAGKRVLVTSQTPRALKVLKGMVPKDMAALCVSLLGNDSTSLKELEDSVYGITNKQHDWNARKNKEEIDHLREVIDTLRRQEADLLRRLTEIRERETYLHKVLDGEYSGTAQVIARRITSERPFYDWIEADIQTETQPPLNDQEALELVKLHRDLGQDRSTELRKSIISPDKLPIPEDFIRNRRMEIEAESHYKNFGSLLNTDIYKTLAAAPQDSLNSLKTSFARLLDTRASVLKHSQPWVPRAVHDVLCGRDRSWGELFRASQDHLGGLMELARKADDRQINLPEGHDRAVMKVNAKSLHNHLAAGGSLGLPLLRPKPVKEAWYLVTKTFVNGQKCDNPDTLIGLIETLEVENRIEKLWSQWSPYSEKCTGGRSMQVGIIEDLCKPLEQALSLYSLLGEARDACSKIQGLLQPSWHIVEEVERYQRTIQAIEAERSLKSASKFFDEMEQAVIAGMAATNPHALLNELLRVVKDRNELSYGKLYSTLTSLHVDRLRYHKRQELQERLSRFAPNLAKEIESEPMSPNWDEKLTRFSQSWRWRQAESWLRKYIEGANEVELVPQFKEIQDKVSHATSRLAAASAWQHCLNHLKEHERRSLQAWTQEVRKVGKGKGKHAELHRRRARENMEECRSAIPAWIMPLYKVAETVKPGVDAYDVVIIDEASQSGPDALLLSFLSKKIIIVGDDQQISPENPGVSRGDVDLLQQKYLRDFPIASKGAIDLDSSFFALGLVVFPGRIVLREHFRCMPEIIQFSNNLCYKHSPLEPLRQYPPVRLQPVLTYHVKDGYREGISQSARNLPEAEAIVEKIAECCKSPEYDCPIDKRHPDGKKTIGVISLLGEYQARLIEQMLLEEIGPEEMSQRNIICGDAYAFQGDERDVMFLSMVAAPGDTQMVALAKQSDMRRFNVAASRARDQMWLFHTPTVNDFRNKECLRYRLLNYCLDPSTQQIDGTRDRCTNEFERAVYDLIVSRGYRVIPQFEVAGYSIDLVIESEQSRLAVECDGDRWHSGSEQQERDMRRQRVLERCGWIFWRVRGSEFYFNREQALESLWKTLEVHQIFPAGQQKASKSTITQENRAAQVINIKDRFTKQKVNTRLEHAIEWSKKMVQREPHFSSEILQNSIVAVLQECPNNSCTKDSLTSRVCKHFDLHTRGQKRIEFEKLVYRALNRLKSKEIVEEYTATNVRIRLVTQNRQPSLFGDA